MPERALAQAFDLEAEGYDRGFGESPGGRVFRHAVQERLLSTFTAGAHVLDLGCGTGEDALFLASLGVRVTGIDVSAGMIARARARAAQAGKIGRDCTFLCRSVEELGILTDSFDGAYSNFGALNCVDLLGLGDALANVLRPGAPVLFNFLGHRPWPALVRGVLAGRWERRGAAAPRVQGVSVRVTYPTLGQARRALGPRFAWSAAWSLGAFVPDPSHADWTVRHPQLFGALSAAEGALCRWPFVRSGGDHFVLEGTRTC